jgi:hypothetical protein
VSAFAQSIEDTLGEGSLPDQNDAHGCHRVWAAAGDVPS